MRIRLTKPVTYCGVTHEIGTTFDAEIKHGVASVVAGHGEYIRIPNRDYELVEDELASEMLISGKTFGIFLQEF